MCGIAGYIAAELPPRSGMDSVMRGAIRYRGRDNEGEWSDDASARLFHSRLSIISLGDGDQPMTDVGGRFTIVFNGEIYNYVELRQQYKQLGAQFRTSSDTEVILEGFKLKGSAVCQDFNGMFAFAIWDRVERRLFLARDRLGKKPLFWMRQNGRFCFASTIDALTSVPGWSGRLLHSAIALYGRLGSFPDDLTVYEQVRALPPASFAFVEPANLELKAVKYWRFVFPATRKSDFDAAAEEYEAILTDSIRLRLRADVPLALTFSGGVDSGTIAALAAKRLGTQLKCYTIDYDVEEDRSAETDIARRVAAHLGLDWQYLHYDYKMSLLTDVGDAYQAFDQPCNHVPMAYSQRLYNMIRPHAKVVLSGGGSDEIFTGYMGNEAQFLQDQIRDASRWLPQSMRRALPRWLLAPIERIARTRDDFASLERDYLNAGVAEFGPDDPAVRHVESIVADILEAGVNSHLDLLQFISLRYYGAAANFLLPDITGLRAQVEVRSPFLDYRMVEFGAALPGAFKVGDGHDPNSVKYLPKKVYAKFVPEEIAWAPKKGMAMNVRFYEGFATDARLDQASQDALSRIEDAGLRAQGFQEAWDDFSAELRAGSSRFSTAGTAVAGFMLGMWLARTPLVEAAA
jgi:asparagine synthase (glutamine-hydrolysing)